MGKPFIGRRRESVCLGIEATSGTSVAPQTRAKQQKLDLDQQTTVAQDKGALGRIGDIHDRAVTEEWAQGSFAGRIYDLLISSLLTNLCGNPTAAVHGSEPAGWDNTFPPL